MKYIKTFEDSRFAYNFNAIIPIETHKYNVGDYVLIDIDKIKKEEHENKRTKLPKDSIGKITGYGKSVMFPYKIAFQPNGNYIVQEDEIIRLLTPEEIEIYNLKKITHKFNL